MKKKKISMWQWMTPNQNLAEAVGSRSGDGTMQTKVESSSAGCPVMSPHKIPWLFPYHFVVFPDHETYYRLFITALTLILKAIWQITHQK